VPREKSITDPEVHGQVVAADQGPADLITPSGDEAWISRDFTLVPSLQADQAIAYKHGSAVVLEHLQSGERRAFLEDVKGGTVSQVAWATDARTLFTTRYKEIVSIDTVTGEVRPVASVAAVWMLAASPTGELLFFQEEGTFSLMSLHIGTGSVELLMADTRYVTFDWSSGVAYALCNVPRSHAEVWRVPLDRSAPDKLATLDTGGPISLSCDRSTLAVGDWTMPSRVRTVDVKTSQVQSIARGNDPTWSPTRRVLAFCGGVLGDERVSLLDESGVEQAWSADGRLLAVTACRARFDHDTFAARSSEPYGHLNSWRYEQKRAVFDLERREVTLRDGHWSDVAWRPSASSG
jgi:hypothetical protein